jgi:hypothetical protein
VRGNSHAHGQSSGNGDSDAGNGLPAVRRKDWQFMTGVIGGRVTIYDFP